MDDDEDIQNDVCPNNCSNNGKVKWHFYRQSPLWHTMQNLDSFNYLRESIKHKLVFSAGDCDPQSGRCICKQGFIGRDCREERCPNDCKVHIWMKKVMGDYTFRKCFNSSPQASLLGSCCQGAACIWFNFYSIEILQKWYGPNNFGSFAAKWGMRRKWEMLL